MFICSGKLRPWLLASAMSCFALSCGSPETRYIKSGDQLRAKAQYQEAANEYESALKENNENAETHLKLAQLYIKPLSNNAKAMEHLKIVVRLNPRNAEAWEGMAVIEQAQRNDIALARTLDQGLKSGAFNANAPKKEKMQQWLQEVNDKLSEPPAGRIATTAPNLDALPGD